MFVRLSSLLFVVLTSVSAQANAQGGTPFVCCQEETVGCPDGSTVKVLLRLYQGFTGQQGMSECRAVGKVPFISDDCGRSRQTCAGVTAESARTEWRSLTGRFVRGNDGKWTETKEGRFGVTYVETARADDVITLNSANGGATEILLYNGTSMIRTPSDIYITYAHGGWVC